MPTFRVQSLPLVCRTFQPRGRPSTGAARTYPDNIFGHDHLSDRNNEADPATAFCSGRAATRARPSTSTRRHEGGARRRQYAVSGCAGAAGRLGAGVRYSGEYEKNSLTPNRRRDSASTESRRHSGAPASTETRALQLLASEPSADLLVMPVTCRRRRRRWAADARGSYMRLSTVGAAVCAVRHPLITGSRGSRGQAPGPGDPDWPATHVTSRPMDVLRSQLTRQGAAVPVTATP